MTHGLGKHTPNTCSSRTLEVVAKKELAINLDNSEESPTARFQEV